MNKKQRFVIVAVVVVVAAMLLYPPFVWVGSSGTVGAGYDWILSRTVEGASVNLGLLAAQWFVVFVAGGAAWLLLGNP